MIPRAVRRWIEDRLPAGWRARHVARTLRKLRDADRAAARRPHRAVKKIKTRSGYVDAETVPLRIVVGAQAHRPTGDLDSHAL